MRQAGLDATTGTAANFRGTSLRAHQIGHFEQNQSAN